MRKIMIYNSYTDEWEEYKEPKVKTFGESVTDKSHYRPNVSKLNDVIGDVSPIDESNYMFKDGKDNGLRFYDITSKSLDITERQEAINEMKAKAETESGEVKEIMNEVIAEQSQNVEKCTTETDTAEA